MSFSIVPPDSLRIILRTNPTLSSTENFQLQKQVWLSIRALLTENQFRCIELTRYKSEIGSAATVAAAPKPPNLANTVLGKSPLRTFMTRGVTMPNLCLSALASTAATTETSPTSTSRSNSPHSPTTTLEKNVVEKEDNVTMRKSPIRANSTSDSFDSLQNSPRFQTAAAVAVEYSVPFEVAQAFATRIYAITKSLSLECQIAYGGKQLFAQDDRVNRRNSDTTSQWNKFAVKNWHEECTSNPNSPRYSPRTSPRDSSSPRTSQRR